MENRAAPPHQEFPGVPTTGELKTDIAEYEIRDVYLGPVYMEVGSPHLTCKRDQIKMRDYVDRRVTSTTRGPPPPCKEALRDWRRINLWL